MKFSKQSVTEMISQPKSGKKVFTEGKKQNVILSEGQLDRLLLQLKESREKSVTSTIKYAHQLIREAIKNESLDLSVGDYSGTIMEQGMYDRNPGIAAGEGLENILNGIKKAYEMIKDSDTRKKLANSITKLGNFMTYTAELVGSGSSQRAPRSYDQLANPLPHPEFETVVDDDEIEDEISENEEVKEDAKPDFLDLDDDGDKKESMKKAAKDKVKEATERKENLIQEEIKKMKQIIKPITKI